MITNPILSAKMQSKAVQHSTVLNDVTTVYSITKLMQYVILQNCKAIWWYRLHFLCICERWTPNSDCIGFCTCTCERWTPNSNCIGFVHNKNRTHLVYLQYKRYNWGGVLANNSGKSVLAKTLWWNVTECYLKITFLPSSMGIKSKSVVIAFQVCEHSLHKRCEQVLTVAVRCKTACCSNFKGFSLETSKS